MARKIFEGIKILDFTQVIAGSYGTTIMGDLGAEVIKVEPPIHGDILRFAGPMYKGESGFFLLNNRNKKSISIDLKKPEGVNLVKRLIPHFDIIAQNYKPGVMDGFGLGYEDVKKIKKDIIYVAVSGYGYNNSYTDKPAYDNIIQAMSGLAAQNGYPEDGRPLRSPLSVADYVAGTYAALGMASAIYHRNRTGEGQFIDVAMYDSLISIMDNSFLIYEFNRERLSQMSPEEKEEDMKRLGLRSSGNRHPGAAPHSFFKTKDGYIAHMSLTNDMWYRLLRVIGREDLIGNPKYEKLDDRKALWKEIDAMVESWTKQHTTDEVIEIFTKNRLPVGKVRTVGEVCEDPQSEERKIFQYVEHPIAGRIRITNIPIKLSETPPEIYAPSPLLGEHNFEVMHRFLGLSEEEVENLTAKGVLYRQEIKK